MKPSDISRIFPFDSVTHHVESEIVAANIAKILARTGDEFRFLGWDEYRRERQKDGGLVEYLEHPEFEKVVKYLETEQTAQLFSSAWSI